MQPQKNEGQVVAPLEHTGSWYDRKQLLETARKQSGAVTEVMVPGYRHMPGVHCGSTALRNLLAFHGAEISEEMAFGLGAGACFYYAVLDGQSPSRFTNGRTIRLDERFAELTGAPLRIRQEADRGRAWETAREVVDAGRPVALLADLYYLDHYGRSAHFPGHVVVLAGYDADTAWLSDTGFEELQATSLEHLRDARHSRHPAYPLDGDMADIAGRVSADSLRRAAPAAVKRAALEMLEPSMGELQGLLALRRLVNELGAWPEVTEDWKWCARFLYQVIERRGTGGGNFRAIYSRFLKEAGYEQADLAAGSATGWTALAEAAREASDSEQARPEMWRAIKSRAARVLESEERLWTSLEAASPRRPLNRQAP